MDEWETARAVVAGASVAIDLGLPVDDAVVLHNSNRLAVRLLPCDLLVRVAPMAHRGGADFEVEVARRLADVDSPLAELDPRVEPRVYFHDGFTVTMWTYYEPLPPHDIAAREYADALQQLHARLRQADLPHPPHFTDRIESAQRTVADLDRSRALGDSDRELLADTLRTMKHAVIRRGAPEQLLHGEPHSGNVLRTARGLRFIDLETCCVGPIEFDIAHASTTGVGVSAAGPPLDVSANYSGADADLVRDCWVLMLAMVIAWRFQPGDALPNGRELTAQWLEALRGARDRG